jgi:hypothetical protein
LPHPSARGFFYLFLDVRTALHHRFFCLPDFFQIGIFARQFFDFFLDQRQTFMGRFILFTFDRFTFDFQLNQTTIELIHHLWFRIDLDLDFDAASSIRSIALSGRKRSVI